jgi:serine/threonine protein kinase
MEYIPKGNVYGLIPQDKKKKINTQIVASIMKDVISSVYYLHNMKPMIIHRDIKPENVLLGENLVAKLTDFGWSNYMQEDEKRTTVCGTPIYLAPEIIKEQGHDEKVDIWCIGVLLFELITGNVPFQGTDLDTLKQNILHLKIAWPKDINIDAKNLIKKILKSDPASRISLEDMLKHQFFTKYFPNAVKSLIKPDDTINYNPFIVSKDDPKTWEPVSKEAKPKNKENISQEKTKSSQAEEECTKENFENLINKYENLQKEIESLKESNPINSEAEEIQKQIKEKEERIAQLTKAAKDNGEDPDESNLKKKCNELETENNELKKKVIHYEEIIKEKQGSSVDNKLKEFRESITGNDKDSYSSEIDNLKEHLDKETRQKLNEIIKQKEKEIKKYKEDEKLRRDKEKKNFITLINKYDKTINWVEKENKELKAKIKELESK